MTMHPLDPHARAIKTVSYVLVVAMILAVLWLRLLPAAIAGLLVYTLSRRLEASLRRRPVLVTHAKAIAVIGVSVVAALILAGIGLGIGRLVEHGHGLEGMLTRIADVLDNLRASLPGSVADYIPPSVTELRIRLVEMLKEHGRQVSTVGIDGLRHSVLALIGLIVGAMVAWSDAPDPTRHKPLAAALLNRLGRLTAAFETVVFAQVKISALNTTLAAIYLLGALPVVGQHVPYSKSLILLTFVAGLIPVVGNLISNAAIVVMSVTASLELAVASLVFLVIVHKLEYFVNARIIGSRIDARAWELILALILMEALFGVGGVIAAPVLYAYMKRELTDAGLIG
ncbi:hypothetical protein LMG7141_01625 [Ralstonia condita]|uniref:Uncharacterized protein n=3 Tax=Ralstonia TaxID=48736 RepID=C6BLE3_RALP1|nr:AI-2E family transporter [Ralstonia sp. LMG 7141]CAJ0785301.1 hypothetical protein LMG7141_01625 [Ralstonia sp. LMG 7141]